MDKKTSKTYTAEEIKAKYRPQAKKSISRSLSKEKKAAEELAKVQLDCSELEREIEKLKKECEELRKQIAQKKEKLGLIDEEEAKVLIELSEKKLADMQRLQDRKENLNKQKINRDAEEVDLAGLRAELAELTK